MNNSGINFGDNVHFGMSAHQGGHISHPNYAITLNGLFREQDLRLEHPREGISLFLNNYCFATDMEIPYEVGEGAVNIGVVLSGSFQQKIEGIQRSPTIHVDAPCDMAVLCDNCDGTMHIKGGEVMRSVGIYIERSLLLELTEGESQFADLETTLDKRGGSFLLGAFSPSPITQLIATQILNCPLSGTCRQLFLEGKTLELISSILGRLGSPPEADQFMMSRYDNERIHEAQRILLTDLIDPPSIKTLARQAGINEFKLKRGFREVFGRTIYQTLRSHRMDHARALMEDSNATVGSVASQVGYTNMSHFIAAFRNQFGVTPGTLLKTLRQQPLS